MYVAAARVMLNIHASASLKDKRRVVHSVVSKLRNQHSVSAAEVDANHSWNSATIGISVVSGDRQTADRLLERAAAFVERAAPEAEVVDVVSDVMVFD